uniref:Uncharacterized protein n=1 Tax=Candidatus Kentrum sp. LPFa TaxID=2126335 RepID=A0A450W405_9GAMM|nr:MAG: hypothetical protein BECKLPF1236B_GA0070989_102421 [Candidatus Kentron sp. LPFa]
MACKWEMWLQPAVAVTNSSFGNISACVPSRAYHIIMGVAVDTTRVDDEPGVSTQ